MSEGRQVVEDLHAAIRRASEAENRSKLIKRELGIVLRELERGDKDSALFRLRRLVAANPDPDAPATPAPSAPPAPSPGGSPPPDPAAHTGAASRTVVHMLVLPAAPDALFTVCGIRRFDGACLLTGSAEQLYDVASQSVDRGACIDCIKGATP